MALYKWNSLQDLLNIQEKMNRLFQDAMERAGFAEHHDEPGRWAPAVDMYETPQEIVLYAELPGVEKEDIDLQIVDDRLVLRGERRMGALASENFVRMERLYGNFRRDFPLPPALESQASDAVFKDGVLKITVPKRPPN